LLLAVCSRPIAPPTSRGFLLSIRLMAALDAIGIAVY